MTSPIRFPLGREIPRLRDPHGFAALAEQATAAGLSFDQRRHAIEQVSVILAAKGGTLAAITVGDCLELIELRDRRKAEGAGHPGWGFYQLLHGLGHFPPDAPTTLRMLDRRFGHQLSVEEVVDQYALACRPVRDLLVAYLAEHRPRLDYASLKQLRAPNRAAKPAAASRVQCGSSALPTTSATATSAYSIVLRRSIGSRRPRLPKPSPASRNSDALTSGLQPDVSQEVKPSQIQPAAS